jgi:murein L,D-transpeptidase YcbB/YkuD
MANNALSYFNGGKKSAYCPDVENYAKAHGQWIDKKHGKKGDVALFDFGKGRASHTGIVEAKNADGTYTIIEGNTSTSSNDNGGKVMRRVRSTEHIHGFYRPKYDELVTADMIVAKAKSQVGTKESPAGSNKVKYNTWYYGKEVSGSAYPWCMAFVSWVFAHTEVKAKAASHHTATAKPVSANTAKAEPAKKKNVKKSAIVEKYQKAYNKDVDPNIGVDGIKGNETTKSFEKVIIKYKKGKAFDKHKNLVKLIQEIVGLKDKDVDGLYGSGTAKKVKAYQKSKGLTDDGIVGPKTWDKMIK